MKIIIFAILILFCMVFLSAEINSSYLCEKTYYGIISEKTETEIAKQIELETGIGSSRAIIKDYMNNWNSKCSDISLKVLDSEEFCSKLYNFVIKNKWLFTEYSITQQLEVRYEVIANYLNNFKELCGYELPKRGENKLILYEQVPCELDSKILGASIPIKFLNIQTNKSCDDVSILKRFFKVESGNNGLQITGIRIYFLVISIFVSFFITIFIINIKTKKIIKHKI